MPVYGSTNATTTTPPPHFLPTRNVAASIATVAMYLSALARCRSATGRARPSPSLHSSSNSISSSFTTNSNNNDVENRSHSEPAQYQHPATHTSPWRRRPVPPSQVPSPLPSATIPPSRSLRSKPPTIPPTPYRNRRPQHLTLTPAASKQWS